jgi:hypothetical protein
MTMYPNTIRLLHPATSLVLAIGASLATFPVRAEMFCVETSVELRDALTVAATNGAADEIRVAVGTYSWHEGFTAFSYQSNENQALTISGDWLSSVPGACDLAAPGTRGTIISGLDERRPLVLSGGTGAGHITVRDLILTRGNSVGAGGALKIGELGHHGDVLIERVHFVDNRSATSGGAMYVESDSDITVTNSVFLRNRAEVTAGAATFYSFTPTHTFRFGNNTVVGNGCTGESRNCTGGIRCLTVAPGAVYNNLFANNEGADLYVCGQLTVANNNIGVVTGPPPPVSIGNVSVADPGFFDADGADVDLRLKETSPLIDAGTDALPLGTTDFDAHPRVAGDQVDIGAYEYPVDR